MTRLIWSIRTLAAPALAAVILAGSAAASHSDVVRHYRFIPSHSTLHVSGGFPGHELDYFPHGDFTLVTGFQEGPTCQAVGVCPPPPHVPFTKFTDVDAWLVPDSPLTYIWWLDETLNFTGLDGTFDPHHPNHLFFHGRDGQGQPFQMQATIHGHLLHLVGENDPECCDFFHYKLDAVAHLRPFPDFNHDDHVDAADFVLWRKMAGTQEEYDAWQRHFGTDIAATVAGALSSPGGGSAFAAVPEPATLTLLLTLAILPIMRRQPRKSSSIWG